MCLRQPLAALEPLLELGMGDVARDDERPGEREPRLDGILREGAADLGHRLGQIDGDNWPAETALVDLGEEARGIALELLEEDAAGIDAAEDLAIGGAGDADADGQAGAVARQADDADVVAEILAAELGADPAGAGEGQDLGLEIGVAEGLAVTIAAARQAVEIVAARELHGLQIHLGRWCRR